MVALVIEVQCLELNFHELESFFIRMWNTYISCSKHISYILGAYAPTFQVYILIKFL